LPYDHPRPAQQDFRGAVVELQLDERLTGQLKELSRRHGVTLFMTVLAGWSVVLSRLSNRTQVVVGTPSANRGRAEIEGLIGFFVNSLALKVELGGAPTVGELLGRVKAVSLGAQAHQDLPFEQVVEMVRPVRSLSHTPVFQTMFAWQNNEVGEFELPGLRVSALGGPGAVGAKFDLELILGEAGDRIVGGLIYASSLFEAATVERFAGYLRAVLREMVRDEDQPVGRIAMLSPGERRQLLQEWNETAAAYPQHACVHELFEEQVQRDPQAVALEFEGHRLSYGQLNERANGLAHHLRLLGVGPEERVAICVERSLEMVVGLLGILKAGGCYVPLDPAYPAERLGFMLGDATPKVVLTHGAARAALHRALG